MQYGLFKKVKYAIPVDKDISRYLFYCMLYREFKFTKKYDVLDIDEFGGK